MGRDRSVVVGDHLSEFVLDAQQSEEGRHLLTVCAWTKRVKHAPVAG